MPTNRRRRARHVQHDEPVALMMGGNLATYDHRAYEAAVSGKFFDDNITAEQLLNCGDYLDRWCDTPEHSAAEQEWRRANGLKVVARERMGR